MEDSWVKPNNVEHIFLLSKEFQKICPFFISIGMTYEQFWYGDLTIAKAYLEAYQMKEKREAEKMQWAMWNQGVYIYEALCDVSPILHAFSKKGTKPLPYPSRPYGMEEKKDKEQPTEQNKKIENLKLQVFFSNWARATKKQFENKRK